MLLSITSDTWIVTGLGFGVVLLLLFCLVFIMIFFGWIMQNVEAPRAPKEEKAQNNQSTQNTPITPSAPSEPEKAAIAMAISEAHSDDIAAVAYALYLAHHSSHDIPTAMISLHKHETAWNEKSIGMNNVGF